MDIFTTLRSQYDSFSKTQRRIADYLLDRPDIVCFSSLRELAAATSTTEATVLSFARKIGFSNFVEMRSEMRAHASQWMSPNKKIASAVQDGPDSDLYASIRETEKQALVQTFQRTGEETLRQAAALLRDARRVFLLAYDYAVTASQFFAARFLRLGVDVLDLGGKGVPEILYRLAMYRPGDLFVLFSYPPYTPMPVELAQVPGEGRQGHLLHRRPRLPGGPELRSGPEQRHPERNLLQLHDGHLLPHHPARRGLRHGKPGTPHRLLRGAVPAPGTDQTVLSPHASPYRGGFFLLFSCNAPALLV